MLQAIVTSDTCIPNAMQCVLSIEGCKEKKYVNACKTDFTEVLYLKIWLDTNLKILLINYQNN